MHIYIRATILAIHLNIFWRKKSNIYIAAPHGNNQGKYEMTRLSSSLWWTQTMHVLNGGLLLFRALISRIIYNIHICVYSVIAVRVVLRYASHALMEWTAKRFRNNTSNLVCVTTYENVHSWTNIGCHKCF